MEHSTNFPVFLVEGEFVVDFEVEAAFLDKEYWKELEVDTRISLININLVFTLNSPTNCPSKSQSFEATIEGSNFILVPGYPFYISWWETPSDAFLQQPPCQPH